MMNAREETPVAGAGGTMHVSVQFGEEQLEFDAPDERVVGVWHGPGAVPAPDVKGLVAAALEQPRNFPPLRQSIVPGDRVASPLDAGLPAAGAVLEAVCEALEAG